MDELLRKLATEGWWAWVILLAVVTIVWLGRHRTGYGALLRAWEPWGSEEVLHPYLAEGERIVLLDGPIAVTSQRMMLRRGGAGFAYAEGSLAQLSNVEYAHSSPLIPLLFGAVYFVLGALATFFGGGVTAMLALGAFITAAGAAIIVVSLLRKPAYLMVSFSSGRPLIVGGARSEDNLAALAKALRR